MNIFVIFFLLWSLLIPQQTRIDKATISGDVDVNYPGMWTRSGVVMALTGNLNELGAGVTFTNEVAEPTVKYATSGCQLIGSPCFKMWFTGDGKIRYAEAPPPGAPPVWTWTISSHICVFTARESYLYQEDSTHYYLFTGGNGIDLYSSSDGINFSLTQSGVITTGTPGQFDSLGVFNMSVIKIGNTYYMAYEASGTGFVGYQIGMATSTNLISWTKYGITSGNQLVGASGPDLHVVGNRLICWYHDYYSAHSDFRRFEATSGTFLSTWTNNPTGNTYTRSTTLDETAQIGDTCIIEVGGISYLLYTGARTVNGPFVIKGATCQCTLAQLLNTKERATNNGL